MKNNKKAKTAPSPKKNNENKTPGFDEEDLQDGMGVPKPIDTSESDLNKDDFDALGPEDLSMDGGDDEDLAKREFPVDFGAKDLDIPGSELDDDQEDIGSEDEENNFYSHGGI